ncbi:MAG: C45 family autoproteolytic acyltransferase/hydrolase, partial [Chloroflexota bacterium]
MVDCRFWIGLRAVHGGLLRVQNRESKMTLPLPLLDVSGAPREIGRAQGEAARKQIGHNLDLYFYRFEAAAEVSRTVALHRGAQYLRVIDTYAPDYGEMMRGLAEASGHDLLEIASLNARYEIMYSEFSRLVMEATDHRPLTTGIATGGGHDGCIAFVALPEATPDGRLRLGQNWDWIP